MPLQQSRKVSAESPTNVLPMLVLISIGMNKTALAQEAQQFPEAPTETIEEIVVYGDKSLTSLRQAIFRAEEDFFDLFSSLNEDEEYDIRCFYETPTGTHIRQHVCRANFVTAATSAAAVTFRTDGPRYPVVPAEAAIMQKRNKLREKMETLVATNPQLLEALSRYTNAKQEYDCEREKKVQGKNVVCSK